MATSLTPLLFNIPANAMNYETKASCTFSGSAPITSLSASPHAHKLVVRMIFTLMCFNFALNYPAGGLKCGSGAGGVIGG